MPHVDEACIDVRVYILRPEKLKHCLPDEDEVYRNTIIDLG